MRNAQGEEMTAEELELLRLETNANCECGGIGPNDPGACEWCLRWHIAITEHHIMESIYAKLGDHGGGCQEDAT